MTKETAYLLGQVYGKLISLNKNWDTMARLTIAMRKPMKAITELHLNAIQSRVFTNDVHEYIMFRLADVSVEDAMSDMNTETSSSFMLGMHSFDLDAPQLIKHIELTQEEIAEKLGVSANTVSRWKLGTSKASQETLYKLQKLRIDPFDFERYEDMVLIDEVWHDPSHPYDLIVEDRGNFYVYGKPFIKSPSSSQFRRFPTRPVEKARPGYLHRYDIWARGLCRRKDVELYEKEKAGSASSGGDQES